MKRNWKILYLISNSIVFVLIAIICSFGFYNSSVSSTIEKYNFESIYTNTHIDFIVPSPSFDQVEKMEKEDNGILVVTPYYSFNTSLSINNKSVSGNIVLLDDSNKIAYTPYNEKRLVSGSIGLNNSYAIVDESYSKKNNCYIGDSVSIIIDSKNYSFSVVAVSESNPFYDGSIALMIDKNDSHTINTNSFKYSAAYVSSNDFNKCKNYLENDYKPLGRLKNRDDFPSDDAYNTHVKNFNSADWSKEITNMKANYNTLSLKYENISEISLRNTIICSTIILIAMIGFNLVAINLPSEKKRFNELLTKKKGNLKEILAYNFKGNIYMLFVMILSFGVLSLSILLLNNALNHFDILLLYTLMPFASVFIGLIVNLIISNSIIRKIYSRK